MKRLLLVVLILAALGISAPIVSAQQGANVRHYGQSRRRGHRTFWRKHRDKLTVAGAAAGGAGIGAIA